MNQWVTVGHSQGIYLFKNLSVKNRYLAKVGPEKPTPECHGITRKAAMLRYEGLRLAVARNMKEASNATA